MKQSCENIKYFCVSEKSIYKSWQINFYSFGTSFQMFLDIFVIDLIV
jgi:hypothetical protein